MPEPQIKRYALVPSAGEDGLRRFHLARVASQTSLVPAAERLERMEKIAALDRRDERANGARPAPPPGRYG